MAQLRCPKCATLIEATPGHVATCPNCGFEARAPGPSPAAKPVAAPSVGRPAATHAQPETQPLKLLSVWAFIVGFVAIGMFFLARFGIPFVLGLVAAVMGGMQYAKNRHDRHALIALILGLVALAAAGIYLAL